MPVCPNCSIKYAEGENFCSQCGARLISASTGLYCPTCNIDYPAGKRFCRRCGTPLVGRHGAAQQPVPRLPAWTCGISADGRADGSFNSRDYPALSLASAANPAPDQLCCPAGRFCAPS